MRSRIAATAAACVFAMIMTAGPALAHNGTQPGGGNSYNPAPAPVNEISSGLITPLKVAFGPHGSFLVAESFAGKLTSISSSGQKSVVVNAPGQEIAGVSYRDGVIYYFDNDQGAGPEPGAALLPARLKTIDAAGRTRTVADLSVYEGAHNPDGKTVYGVRTASDSCLAEAPYLRSMGELFSHPYSSAPARGGVYVGDAGANAIMFVSDSGKVKLIRQLPAEPITIDSSVVSIAASMGMVVPDCMLGLKYYAQAVPTDVEVSGSWIYYTVLPGVPGEMLGVGKVYRTNLNNGQTELVARDLKAPTGVAVSGEGVVYVAQLMGDGVSIIKRGTTTNVIPAAMASDVELNGNTLAALTNALADSGGSLVTKRLR
ncbi:hypothetical protein MB46_03765 [Arthrobacter alpinus]|uniref:ScyD/ScyE family protein n=1 Tax=Arthrobacter alpinus TaxID=656366 RepID=UPI0005CA49C3|nr:ScyD/ScyE family protein [Arthrobacter alpinus]ALV44761.1 hypothetical protein MB46_03765 [Arthrobacter alpinus]